MPALFGARRALLYRPIVSSGAIDNPLTIFGADLIGWWMADTDVTTSGGNVTSVLDQSGNGKTLTNTGNVPLNETGFNGLPTFDFAAANNAYLKNLSFTGFGSGQTGAFFMAGQMKTGTAANGRAMAFVGNTGGHDFDNTGSCIAIARNGSGNSFMSYCNSSLLTSTSISLATNYRLGAVFDGTNVTHYVNNSGGTPAADSGLAFSTAISVLSIAAGITSGNPGGDPWDGPISEIVITKIAPNSTQLNSLDSWLTSNWGL